MHFSRILGIALLAMAINIFALSSALKLPYELTDTQLRSLEIVLAKGISEGLIWQMQKEIQLKSQIEPKFSIIPPLDDPLTLPATNLCGFNIAIPELFALSGDLNILQAEAVGLSKFVDDLRFFSFPTLGASVNLTLDLPSLMLTAPYILDSVLSLIPGPDQPEIISNITGDGDILFGFDDFFLRVYAKGKIPYNQSIELESLDVDVGFKNLKFDPSGFKVNDALSNVSGLAGTIEGLFTSLWPTLRPTVNELIRCTINNTVSGCTINDILLFDLRCLNLEPDPSCMETSLEMEELNEGIEIFTSICEATQEPEPEGTTTTTKAPPENDSTRQLSSKFVLFIALGYSFVF